MVNMDEKSNYSTYLKINKEYNMSDKTNTENGYFRVYEDSRIVWHNIRKNPNDLPSGPCETLCYCTNVDNDKDCRFYGVISYSDGKFYLDEDGESFNDIIIAWSEIPRYEDQDL